MFYSQLHVAQRLSFSENQKKTSTHFTHHSVLQPLSLGRISGDDQLGMSRVGPRFPESSARRGACHGKVWTQQQWEQEDSNTDKRDKKKGAVTADFNLRAAALVTG